MAPTGSALVYWDSGNPTPPNGNPPPPGLGQDPHSDPRKDDVALQQVVRFVRDRADRRRPRRIAELGPPTVRGTPSTTGSWASLRGVTVVFVIVVAVAFCSRC